MSPQRKFTIAGSAVYITAVAIAWRITGHIDLVNVILVIGFVWMLGDRVGLHELLEDNRADTDQNGRDIDDVKAHLTGNDQPSSGRHAHSDAKPYYKPSPTPYPRSAA